MSLLDDRAYYVPQMRHFEGQGRSSLPVRGYVPRVWPKSSICPTSPRLRRAVSLSSTLMAKKLDLQAGTEAESFAFTDIDKPRRAGGECFNIGAFGHEKDPIGGNGWKAGQEILNLDQIVFG